MTREKPSGGTWRTKQVYTLKQEPIGQIISERTQAAWNAQGTPTAWTDLWYHFDMRVNTIAITSQSGSPDSQKKSYCDHPKAKNGLQMALSEQVYL